MTSQCCRSCSCCRTPGSGRKRTRRQHHRRRASSPACTSRSAVRHHRLVSPGTVAAGPATRWLPPCDAEQHSMTIITSGSLFDWSKPHIDKLVRSTSVSQHPDAPALAPWRFSAGARMGCACARSSCQAQLQRCSLPGVTLHRPRHWPAQNGHVRRVRASSGPGRRYRSRYVATELHLQGWLHLQAAPFVTDVQHAETSNILA